MKVLFLSVSTGGGHLKAAEAIKEGIELRHPLSEAIIVDTLKYINPVVDRLVVGGYLSSLRARPQIYGKIYEISELNDNIYYFSKAINNLFSLKIKSLINEFEPTVIVCTHLFPVQMLSALKKKQFVNTPVIAVITDFVSHPYWVHEQADAFVVAHENMGKQLTSMGVPGSKVFPFGIPVAGRFLINRDRLALLKELGLENKPTVLIMGGSLGMGEISGSFLSLLNNREDLQIIVITGENIKMKRELEHIAERTSKSVRILSYTDRVSDYMDVSDLIITKPGGMTVSEALVKQLPILILSPIPGQEERNASFLIKEGVAVRITNASSINRILEKVLYNPSKIRQMRKAAVRLGKPEACRNIVDLLEKLDSCKSDH